MTIEVLDAAVNWRDGYENDPSLTFLLSEMPTFGPYDRRPIPGEPDKFYWTENEGFARFFVWAGRPDNGYGGRRRTVKIDDGTEEEIVGGWSSRGEVAAAVGHPSTVPVAVRTDYHTVRSEKVLAGGTGMHMTHARFRREVERLLPDVEVVEAPYDTLTVRWRGQASKAEFMAVEHVRQDTMREGLKGFYGRDWYELSSDEERDLLACRPYSALGPVVVSS